MLAGAALGLASLGLPGAALADPVVQSLPQQSPGMKLNDALNQLARNPQDLEALIAAGRASLELGDVQAAIGFFKRADTLWPGSVRAKTGLAGAYALGDDPIAAIQLFDQAEKLGPIDPARISDRGLAYDRIGDYQTAQGYYRQALGIDASDETARRLALSQAIAGDRRGMEVTLGPLLQKQDKAAWRTRAFALAILGVPDEAESIARQTMPADMANSMAGYLRYMPKLTPAQQASAANLGQFPRAADIGQNDPRFAAYMRPHAVLAAASPVPGPVKPDAKGKDKGRKGKDQSVLAVAAAVPSPPVSREVEGKPVQVAMVTPQPAVPRPLPAPIPAPTSTPAPVVPRPVPTTTSTGPGFASIDQVSTRPAQSFDLRQQTKPPVPVAAPVPTPAPARVPPPPKPAPRPAPKPESIDEAFADFTPPSRETEPQAGAVDLRRLASTKPAVSVKPGDKKAAEKEVIAETCKPAAKGTKAARSASRAKDCEAPKAKDPKLSQPSRFWVQVATGRDKAALGSDWRRMLKDDPAVFKGKKPFLTAWGQTNRLLTGPFETQKEANAFVAALKKAQFSGAFAWTSAAGQVVDPLASGK
jgi:Flp pilus assembly protein TadD